jgi:hypothetical protein
MSENAPENFNKEPLPLKLWGSIGKALLPTLLSSRVDVESGNSRRILQLASVTETLSLAAALVNPALGLAGYGVSRLSAMLAEKIGGRSRSAENFNAEPFPIKLWSSLGKILLPTVFSARRDIHGSRRQAIVIGSAAAETISLAAMLVNPVVGAFGYGASRLASLLGESLEMKHRR